MPLPNKIRRRKTRKNRDEEALLQKKDAWYFLASNVIEEIKALKRGVAGRGDSTYRLPPSKLHEPIPANVSSFLNQLTTKYRKLSSDALDIMEMQKELAEKSPVHKEVPPNAMHPSRTESPLAKLDKASSTDYQMIIEASGAISRTWFSTKSLFSKQKRAARDMLYLLLEAKNLLADMQFWSVTKSKETSSKVTSIAKEISDRIRNVNSAMQLYAKFTGNESYLLETGLVSDTESGFKEQINFYTREFGNATSLGYDMYTKRFKALLKNFASATSKIDKEDTVKKISDTYKELIADMKENPNYKNIKWTTVTELHDKASSIKINTIPIEKAVERSIDEYEKEFIIAERLNGKKIDGFVTIPVSFLKDFNGLKKRYLKDKSEQSLEQIKDLYLAMIKFLREHFGKKFQDWTTVSDLYDLITADIANGTKPPVAPSEAGITVSSDLEHQLTITANKFLRRHLKKLLRQIDFTDSSGNLRIELFNFAGKMRESVNSFMNDIEGSESFEKLAENLRSLKKMNDELENYTHQLTTRVK